MKRGTVFCSSSDEIFLGKRGDVRRRLESKSTYKLRIYDVIKRGEKERKMIVGRGGKE